MVSEEWICLVRLQPERHCQPVILTLTVFDFKNGVSGYYETEHLGVEHRRSSYPGLDDIGIKRYTQKKFMS